MRQKLISASLATCLSVASVNSVVAQGDVPLFGEPVNSLNPFSREALFGEPVEPLVDFSDEALEEEQKRQIIYNNCVISKSKGVDRSVVILEVRSVCRKISENPTIFQRLRWGR